MVVYGGHEVGTHGYSHENPVSMTPQQEKDVIDKCVGLVEDLTGKKPAGNSAPWWDHRTRRTRSCWSTATSTTAPCSITTSRPTGRARATSEPRSVTPNPLPSG